MSLYERSAFLCAVLRGKQHVILPWIGNALDLEHLSQNGAGQIAFDLLRLSYPDVRAGNLLHFGVDSPDSILNSGPLASRRCPITITNHNDVGVDAKQVHEFSFGILGRSELRSRKQRSSVKRALIIAAFLQLASTKKVDPAVQVDAIRRPFDPDDTICLKKV